jgi:hypothetical protein
MRLTGRSVLQLDSRDQSPYLIKVSPCIISDLSASGLLPEWGGEYRKPSCLIPWFDGEIFSQEWKEALWGQVRHESATTTFAVLTRSRIVDFAICWLKRALTMRCLPQSPVR